MADKTETPGAADNPEAGGFGRENDVIIAAARKLADDIHEFMKPVMAGAHGHIRQVMKSATLAQVSGLRVRAGIPHTLTALTPRTIHPPRVDYVVDMDKIARAVAEVTEARLAAISSAVDEALSTETEDLIPHRVVSVAWTDHDTVVIELTDEMADPADS